MLDELTTAIDERSRVRLRYADELGRRIFEPHILFVSAAGVVCVEGMQVSGVSRTGLDEPAWRRFDVPKIRRLEVTSRRFQPSEVFNPEDERYARIIASCVDD